MLTWQNCTRAGLTMADHLSGCVFTYSGSGELPVTREMKECFNEHGFIIVRSILSSDELKKLKEVLESSEGIMENAFAVPDGHGKNNRISLWNHPGEDVTGMVGRCEKIAGTTEQLLGGEVYHYHTKLIMKEAHTGGAFVWHQDYGYWYQATCLYPDMASVFIAIDKATTENGCLKILKGSHKAGRIDHVRVGGQNGADMERVEMLMKLHPLIEVELEAGDALFFHCNVLHRSDQNRSNNRRWAFIVSYNRASNNPVRPHHHPQYTPLHKVSNTAIMDCQSLDLSGKWFMDPKEDKTIDAKKISDKN